MPNYFPRQTVEWHLEEPAAFRRLSLSLVEMAVATGIVLRLLRAFAFTHGRASLLLTIGAVLLWGLILLGMATAHLANYPIQRWTWRAPLFALVETAGEMATSLLLITLGREAEGTARAHFHDWPSMAARAAAERVDDLPLGTPPRRRASRRAAQRSCRGSGCRAGDGSAVGTSTAGVTGELQRLR
jgi:hypothetical protein